MREYKKLALLILFSIIVMTLFRADSFCFSKEDPRQWMHGISLVQQKDGYIVFFSSNGYPPRKSAADWEHDIYYAKSTPALYSKKNEPEKLCYPNPSGDLIEMSIKDPRIIPHILSGNIVPETTGNTGLYIDKDHVLWIYTSKKGLQFSHFKR